MPSPIHVITAALATALLLAAGTARGDVFSEPTDIELASHHECLDCTTCNSCTGSCDACGSVACCDTCCDCCCCPPPPTFVFTGGWLYMAREHYRNSPIVTDGVTGATLLSADDFDGQYDSGFEVSGRLGRLNVRYFQIGNDASAAVTSPNAIFTGAGATPSTYDYDTDLYNGEINVMLSDPTACVRFDTGFRYLRLNEDLGFNFAPPVPPPRANTLTRNNMYGLQLGMEADLLNNYQSLFSMTCFTKAAICFSDTRLHYSEPPAGVDVADSSQRVGFIGEVGLKGHLNLGRVSLDAGYQVLFINGVALAGDQPQNINILVPSAVITTDNLLYHGFIASATVRF